MVYRQKRKDKFVWLFISESVFSDFSLFIKNRWKGTVCYRIKKRIESYDSNTSLGEGSPETHYCLKLLSEI